MRRLIIEQTVAGHCRKGEGMKHEIVRAALSLSVMLAIGYSAGTGVMHRVGGLVREDLSRIPWLKQVRQEPVKPGRPDADSILHVDLSSEMPPIGDQGSQGSCVCWALAYYHTTHNEWVEHHWNVNDSQYQYSPAFVYNQTNGGADDGIPDSWAMELMLEHGVANLVDCPYADTNCTNWPSESAYSHALRFRGAAGCWIGTLDTAGRHAIKQHLANGYTCCIGINVWGNFQYIQNYNNTYCVADTFGADYGGHDVTIVGYDDTITTHDGHGAFKLANSWGTSWGTMGGYFWMSYQALADTCLGQGYAVYVVERPDYQPTMLARVQLTHPARDKVGIQLGVGPTRNPLWTQDFRRFRYPIIDQPFPNHPMVFDATEGEQFIAAGLADTVFVRAIDDSLDHKTGTLDYFSCQRLTTNDTSVSSDPPESIPDQGVPVYARTTFGYLGDVCCLAYDDGVPQDYYCYAAKDYGWGARFQPQTYPCRVIGASVHFNDLSWPQPGGDRTVIRILGESSSDSSPSGLLFESDTLHVARGQWTLLALPESTIVPITSGGFYLFVVQADSYPSCPAISVDSGLTRPNPWWRTGDDTYWPCDTLVSGDFMIRALVQGVAGVAQELAPAPGLRDRDAIRSVSPSPVSTRAAVEYWLAEEDNVTLSLLDVSGRTVQVLVHERQGSGTHKMNWRPDPRLAPGVYFVALRSAKSGARPAVRKVVLSR
jgi:hypothetical protein